MKHFRLEDPPPPEIYPLSLHDALPISRLDEEHPVEQHERAGQDRYRAPPEQDAAEDVDQRGHEDPGDHSRQPDRKSTRLNSSHLVISYAVFCLKKKNCPSHSTRVHTLR